MLDVKNLIDTFTGDVESIKIWTKERGMDGVYAKAEWLPDEKKDAIVRAWNIRDGSLCILI